MIKLKPWMKIESADGDIFFYDAMRSVKISGSRIESLVESYLNEQEIPANARESLDALFKQKNLILNDDSEKTHYLASILFGDRSNYITSIRWDTIYISSDVSKRLSTFLSCSENVSLSHLKIVEYDKKDVSSLQPNDQSLVLVIDKIDSDIVQRIDKLSESRNFSWVIISIMDGYMSFISPVFSRSGCCKQCFIRRLSDNRRFNMPTRRKTLKSANLNPPRYLEDMMYGMLFYLIDRSMTVFDGDWYRKTFYLDFSEGYYFRDATILRFPGCPRCEKIKKSSKLSFSPWDHYVE